VVKVYPKVVRGAWYRVACARQGDTVTATVQRLGTTKIDNSSATCSIGVVDTSGDPMSIGGKADPDGSAASGSSDQFNGAIDNVHVELN
jgi:hypothetical protein